jgi:hypothetical protein
MTTTNEARAFVLAEYRQERRNGKPPLAALETVASDYARVIANHARQSGRIERDYLAGYRIARDWHDTISGRLSALPCRDYWRWGRMPTHVVSYDVADGICTLTYEALDGSMRESASWAESSPAPAMAG